MNNTVLERKYFLEINGKQEGPFSKSEVLNFLNNASIGPENRIWFEGMADWEEIEKNSDFFQNKSDAVITESKNVIDKKKFISTMIRSLIEKYGYMPPENQSGERNPGDDILVLSKELFGSFTRLEFLDGDNLSCVEIKEIMLASKKLLVETKNTNYFFEIFIFLNNPGKEKLEIIKTEQYIDIPKLYLRSITINVSSRSFSKYFIIPFTFSLGMTDAIKNTLSVFTSETSTPIRDIKESLDIGRKAALRIKAKIIAFCAIGMTVFLTTILSIAWYYPEGFSIRSPSKYSDFMDIRLRMSHKEVAALYPECKALMDLNNSKGTKYCTHLFSENDLYFKSMNLVFHNRSNQLENIIIETKAKNDRTVIRKLLDKYGEPTDKENATNTYKEVSIVTFSWLDKHTSIIQLKYMENYKGELIIVDFGYTDLTNYYKREKEDIREDIKDVKF